MLGSRFLMKPAFSFLKVITFRVSLHFAYYMFPLACHGKVKYNLTYG